MPALNTLGTLELLDDAGRPLGGRRKVLGLLAWLAARGPRGADREEVAALLWDIRDPANARRSLRQALSELRELLSDRVIPLEAERLALPAAAVETDVARFERAVREGRPEQALELWRGPFLAGLDDLGGTEWRSWLDGERGRLARLLAAAGEAAVEAGRRQGGTAGALTAAERWAGLDPESEAAEGAVIRALLDLRRGPAARDRHDAFLARLAAQGESPSADFARIARSLPEATPADPATRGFLTPDLAGRAPQLAALHEAWQRSTAGAALVVLVEGEEGMGKTRLLDEFLLACRRAPRAVAVGTRASRAERTRPLAALSALADALAGAPGLAAAHPGDLAALAGLGQVLHERFRLDGTTRPAPLEEALPRVLAEVAAERPLVVAVDDADQADPESQRVLTSLALRAPPGVLLVLTGNPGWTGALPPLGELPPDRAVRVHLPPLDPLTLRALVGSMGPLTAEAGAALASAAADQLGGSPGHARALVTDWAERGVLRRADDGVWGLAPGPVPPGLPADLEAALGARIRSLGPEARAILDLAAVAEPPVDDGRIERAAGLPVERFRMALGEVLAWRFLRRPQGRPGGLEFQNEATRRLVRDGLTEPRRVELRQRLADGPARSPRRRTPVIAAAAVLVVLAGTAAVLARRTTPSPGIGTILAAVEDRTGTPGLGATLSWLATVELNESAALKPLPRSQVRSTLARMERPGADSALDADLAREVALRAGIPTVLVLSVALDGGAFLLSARLMRTASGDPIRTLTRRADSREELVDAFGRLLRQVRLSAGEGRAALAEIPDLPHLTTRSLDALLALAEGRNAWTARRYGEAGAAFRRAVALDSGFAVAWLSLSDFEYLRNNLFAGERYLRRALELVDATTPRERLELRAVAATRLGPVSQAIAYRRDLAERYPERDTWYNLGTALMRNGQCDQGIPALHRALAYDSGFVNGYVNLATCLHLTGSHDSSVLVYRQAERRDSGALLAGNIGEEFGRTLLFAGRPAEARLHYQRMAGWGGPADRARGHRQLAWIAMAGGRYREAEREARTALALHPPGRNELSPHRDRLVLAAALLGRGDTTAARETFRAAWRTRPDSMIDMGTLERAIVLARRLRLAALMPEVRSEMERRVRPDRLADSNAVRTARAWEAVLTGRRVDTAALEREPTVPANPVAWDLRWLVRAELDARTGQLDSAIARWELVRARPRLATEFQETWQRADLEIARLAERAGRTSLAREAIERFLSRWQDADPETPEFREALALRRRLLDEGP